MSILAEKLEAAIEAKKAEQVTLTGDQNLVPLAPLEPIRRGSRKNKGMTKRMLDLLKRRAGRGLTANEAANELSSDAGTTATCLSQLHKQSRVYRQSIHENHGPAGGSRYKYFYLEAKAKQIKPKPANAAPPYRHGDVLEDWQKEDDDEDQEADIKSDFELTADTPDIFAKPTFKLEIRKVYFMVLSNGKEVEITAEQYSALGGIF